MFVDRLTFVVVVRMSVSIRACNGLGRLVGLESKVALLVLHRTLLHAETVVAKHQVVVCLDVFGINRQDVLEFFYGFRIFLLQKENPACFIPNDTIVRKLRADNLQMRQRVIVGSFSLEYLGIEEVSTSQVRGDLEGSLEHFASPGEVAFKDTCASYVHETIGVIRRDRRDCLEGEFRTLQVPLQE